METPCPICPTRSNFIQDKLEIYIWTSIKEVINTILYFVFRLIYLNLYVIQKSVWILISWLLKKPADLDLHCRVPTSSGNHGKPGKSQKSSMHGKIMEFEKPE